MKQIRAKRGVAAFAVAASLKHAFNGGDGVALGQRWFNLFTNQDGTSAIYVGLSPTGKYWHIYNHEEFSQRLQEQV